MAGNKNPWRDIATAAEWQDINYWAAPAVPRPLPVPPLAPRLQAGLHRAAPVGNPMQALPLPPAPALQPQVQAGQHRLLAPTVDEIGAMLTDYHQLTKDDHRLFGQRATKLNRIARQAELFLINYQRVNLPGAKGSNWGRELGDPIDVWVRSLAHRAAKKAGYLTKMEQWHQTAKAKYTDRVLMSAYLRGLAEGGHVKDGGAKLHATPYATIEKVDPYHRQTFVFLDPDQLGAWDQGANLMGEAFLQYLRGPDPVGSTNVNPSFYEWLEYHPFCLGTPGVHGENRFKNPPKISYTGHDLTHVRVEQGRLMSQQIVSAPGVWGILDTSTLPPSGKGPANAAAFVWDSDCHLYLHAHGHDEFIHASAKQGRKIRCSGMLVVTNGIVTYMSNQSGHYAPAALNLYHFGKWLNAKRCTHVSTTVEIDHGTAPLDGQIEFAHFLQRCRQVGMIEAAGLSYPT